MSTPTCERSTASGQISDAAHSALAARSLSGIPLGRLGEPPKKVGPVLFLAPAGVSMCGTLAMNAGASIDW